LDEAASINFITILDHGQVNICKYENENHGHRDKQEHRHFRKDLGAYRQEVVGYRRYNAYGEYRRERLGNCAEVMDEVTKVQVC
jgi:hypothetical protein